MKDRSPKPKLFHPLEFYLEHLTTIHGVPLTHREIDVISCLLNGRNTKGIANFLSIAPKTVATHIYNSTKRFGCSSDRMVTLIEQSNQFINLKEHYVALLVNNLFIKTLKEIATQAIDNNTPLKCVLIYWQKKPLFLEPLEHDLTHAGLMVSHECRKEVDSFSQLTGEVYHDAYPIYFLPDFMIRKQQTLLRAQGIDCSSDTKIFFLPKSPESGVISQEDCPFFIINPSDWPSYYFSVFVILKKILPTFDLEEHHAQFERQAHALCRSLPVQSLTENLLKEEKEEKDDGLLPEKILITKKIGYAYAFLGILSIGGLYLWSSNHDLITVGHKRGAKQTRYQGPHTKHENMAIQPIRSDLAIPSSATLLNRPDLINKIDMQFENQQDENIQTVALIGIGGAGKTTLAHQYASLQKLSVVWEINAETTDSLIQSFESLARALAQTEGELKVLRSLQGIKNLEERRERMMAFVKEKLRSHSPWLLIYDNVEQFVDAQRYFPGDPRTWGQGKVIITTRDINVQTNKYINSVIRIGELNPDQKFTLFSKIMSKQDASLLSPLQVKEAKAFLEKLPPFPLDITHAAYYLKATDVPYETYLENLEENHKNFVDIENSLLEEVGHYTKNRYGIISISLQKLINTDKDFRELLLLISLLDSQSIPKGLLEVNKNRLVVDKFIFHLKKHSLIISEFSTPAQASSRLSFHRSTQGISLAYLKKTVDLQKNSQLMSSITVALEKYAKQIEEKQDYSKMKSFVSHCEFFLSHRNMLTDIMRASIQRELGTIYFHLGQYKKARNLLEESLEVYMKHRSTNYTGIAKALTYLGNVYRKFGNYEKAKDLLEQSVAIHKKFLPDNHSGIVRSLTYLGLTFKNLGDYNKAKDLFEQSLEINNRYIPQNHVGTFNSLVNLGTVYRNLGNYEKSRDLLEVSLTVHKKEFSENHIAHARILAHLGNIYRKLGNYEKAKGMLEQSLIIYEREFVKNHICIGWVCAYLGNVYSKMGEQDKARAILEKSRIIFKQNYHDNHIDVAWVSALLARVYCQLGNYEPAKALLEESFAVYKKNFPEDHVVLAWAATLLGSLYAKLGEYEKAKHLLETSLIVYENYYGKNHIETVRLVKDMGHKRMLSH